MQVNLFIDSDKDLDPVVWPHLLFVSQQIRDMFDEFDINGTITLTSDLGDCEKF